MASSRAVPLAIISRIISSYSAFDPSHHCTRSGWQSDSISATQELSFAFLLLIEASAPVSLENARGPTPGRRVGFADAVLRVWTPREAARTQDRGEPRNPIISVCGD